VKFVRKARKVCEEGHGEVCEETLSLSYLAEGLKACSWIEPTVKFVKKATTTINNKKLCFNTLHSLIS
jgi:hypothetical protein